MNPRYGPLFTILLFGLALAGGQVVSSRSPELRTGPEGAPQDLLGRLFGGGREALSQRLVTKADTYFHGGVEHRHEEGEEHGCLVSEGHEQEIHEGHADHHPEHDHGPRDEHHDHENAPKHRDWWSRINQARAPDAHTHLQGERYEKEIVPWAWAAVKADPHNIDAQLVIAYWLGRRLQQTDSAMDVLRDAIRENPESYRLELEKARLLRATPERRQERIDALNQALLKWQRRHATANGVAPEPEERIELGAILELLAEACEQEGDLPAAKRYFEQALPYAAHKEGIRTRIRELDRRLAQQAPHATAPRDPPTEPQLDDPEQ